MGLSSENREKIRSGILTRLKKLEEDIQYLRERTKPIAPENAIGRISRMDAINNKSIDEAALRNAIERQSKLQRALKDINADHFGLCGKCGESIETGRLLIVPEAKLCMTCLKN